MELHWQHCRQCGTYLKIDNDCTRDYKIRSTVHWQPRLDEDNHTNTDTHKKIGLLFATTIRATIRRIRQDVSASDVGWTFTRTLTPVGY